MRSRMFLIILVPSVVLAVSCLIGAQSPKDLKLTADDYVQIQQLYADYVYALDQAQGERFVSTFVDDGEFTGVHVDGRTPATDHGKKGLLRVGGKDRGARTFLSNLLITRTPEGAKASCYLVQLNVKNVPPTLIKIAVYEDTLAKTAQGWKFRKRIAWADDDDLSPFKPRENK